MIFTAGYYYFTRDTIGHCYSPCSYMVSFSSQMLVSDFDVFFFKLDTGFGLNYTFFHSSFRSYVPIALIQNSTISIRRSA